jgi:ADP-ribose pyrophosphatase
LRPWRVIEERGLLSCAPFIEVSAQTVELPDGRRIENFYQLVMPDYACVFPELDDGRILLLRCYRHGARRVCLNFPGGHLVAGEDALAGAKRELLEETGYEAAEWRPLGSFVTNGNHRGQTAHFFRARQCRRVKEADSGDLEEAELVTMTTAELGAALGRGEFPVASQAMLLALATHPSLTG